jgi:hypothetical protein
MTRSGYIGVPCVAVSGAAFHRHIAVMYVSSDVGLKDSIEDRRIVN